MLLSPGVQKVTGPEKAIIGVTYNLTCSVIAYGDEPEITWTKDNVEISAAGESYASPQVRNLNIFLYCIILDFRNVEYLLEQNFRIDDNGSTFCFTNTRLTYILF